jgi:hypothetical protein
MSRGPINVLCGWGVHLGRRGGKRISCGHAAASSHPSVSALHTRCCATLVRGRNVRGKGWSGKGVGGGTCHPDVWQDAPLWWRCIFGVVLQSLPCLQLIGPYHVAVYYFAQQRAISFAANTNAACFWVQATDSPPSWFANGFTRDELLQQKRTLAYVRQFGCVQVLLLF